MTILIELLLYTVFAFTAWYFLYRAVPRLGQWTVLCMLHNLRDDVYRIKSESSAAQDSLVIEDILFSLTLLIHVVRDKPRRIALPFLIRTLSLGLTVGTGAGPDDWRAKRYAFEKENIFASDDECVLLNKALALFQRRNAAVMLYLATAHPFIFVPVATLFLVLAPILAIPVWLIYAFLWIPIMDLAIRHPDIGAVGKNIAIIRAYEERPRRHSFA